MAGHRRPDPRPSIRRSVASCLAIACLTGSTLIVGAPPVTAETTPAATDALLDATYRALAPSNLRTTDGPPTTVARGSVVDLRFELTNASSRYLRVPRSDLNGMAGWWVGSIRVWLAPLAPATTADIVPCLIEPTISAGRILVSLQPLDMGWADRIEFQPGTGSSHDAQLPAGLTRCLPMGRYRATVEYTRLGATSGDAALSSSELRITIVPAGRWTATLALPTMSGRIEQAGFAEVSAPRDATAATVRISVAGAVAGSAHTLGILAGGCARAGGVPLTGPVEFTTGSNGTYDARLSLPIDASGATTLATTGTLAVTLLDGGATICMPGEAVPPAPPARRAPSTWGGGRLWQKTVGYQLVASSTLPAAMPAMAVDGNRWTMWNAGMPTPAWIELDLLRNRVVTGAWLLPAQTPSPARTVHRVWGRASGSSTERLLATISRTTSEGTWIRVTFRATTVRFVRIETVSSPSAVAWFEIGLTGPGLPGRSVLPEGAHDGWRDFIAVGDQCSANGWAWDPDSPKARVTVRVLVDGRVVARATANQWRPDVRDAGYGDGWSGYGVPLRGRLTLERSHFIRVQAKDVGSERWVTLGEGFTIYCR